MSSIIPWETLLADHQHGPTPACVNGISRQYAVRNLSTAKWAEPLRTRAGISILLVTDPSSNLPQAVEEASRIREMVRAMHGVSFVEIRGPEVTRENLLRCLRSGLYDVVHYAGHAFYDPNTPERSGLVCAGTEDNILSGQDLAQVNSLPALMFLNACESARVRGGAPAADRLRTSELRSRTSVAEALMRGGIANFLGTYWPVRDESARDFATRFYKELLEGNTIGAAVTSARQAVFQSGSGDWADYLHYGLPNFVLKAAARNPQS
jgi:CHAT domain-containing protein